MCGIAGVFDTNSNSSVNRDLLKKMSDVIAHRGPDSDGLYISESNCCGLSFRRLAIIDLSDSGNQPMTTRDGRYTIVFNGEIYNHRIVREELIKSGFQYHSETDTETILYGFERFGFDIIEKFVGMWAFAIWDNQEQKLFASRDRIGIKPFYYYFKNGIFVFGSEIKSILEHTEVKREFNFDELPNYLNYSMSSSHSTLFRNIHKLPAAHWLSLNQSGDLEIRRYWSPLRNKMQLGNMSESDVHENIITLLRQSIKDRMMSDVPFGVFLSGGIDSSANVALMSELMDRPVDTFTVGFKDLQKYNELQYANQIAEQFKTNHHEILIDQRDSIEVLETLAWHEDEPNGDPVCIPLYYLSKLTRQSGTTVIQVGEGSDEQFIGYDWMLRDYNFHNSYWKFYTGLPNFSRKMIYSGMKPILNGMNQYIISEYFRRGTSGEELYWSGASRFSPTMLEQLLKEEFQHLGAIPYQFAKSMHESAIEENPNSTYLQRMTYLELYHRLSDILLMRVDKITMAHSLEARVPFLDHRLVEFAMNLPDKMKVPNQKDTKILLKNALKGVLPDNIIHRKKQGFAAPVKEWLRNEWYDYARDEIMNSFFVKEKVFDKVFIEKLFVLHKSGKFKLHNEIFLLLMLAIWHKKYFS
ncbi:MAG: asparagine synthase (glutamine-hydrolyzing) [Candidatus Kapabacteria bacterium]|nr:asparagine synthase (glutamine-hydrolyzing) [Candidatus Kapabacteria bacterium]